jgi:hypothetical protein
MIRSPLKTLLLTLGLVGLIYAALPSSTTPKPTPPPTHCLSGQLRQQRASISATWPEVFLRCLAGHYAARLTPTGAELLSALRSCSEGGAHERHIEGARIWRVGVA